MLTVRDIMQAEVTTAAPDMSVRHLTRLLSDADVSGMPVVDRGGALQGVVSATDVVRFASEDGGVRVSRTGLRASHFLHDFEDDEEEDPEDPFGFFLPEDSPVNTRVARQQVAESRFDTVTVEEIMTPVTFSVEPTITLEELSGFLVRGRIHRAVVVEDGKLVGIVTSGDVLQAVADGRLRG